MLGKLSVFAFIVGSGYLASGGFSWIIRQNGQIEAAIIEMGSSVGFEAERTVLLAAFLAGMLLQAGVVQAWRGAFESGLISANTLLAIGLSVVSMVSSSGNALLAFKYNELTNAKLMAASAPMRSESEEAIAKVALLSQSADAMSNSSRARAREEDLTGGSCSNVPAQRGKGSIWTMRQRHQSEAAEISRGLDALAFQLDGLLSEFETGSGSPDQRAKNLQRAVRDALRSSEVHDLFDRSQVLRNDMVLGWTHVNEDIPVGQPSRETERTCTDVGYQSTLEDFVDDFQGVMATRLSSVIIDDTGLDDGFSLVFS
ncbi:MAG: hypothetical protein ABJD12_18620, partial [Roseobacter sp.]